MHGAWLQTSGAEQRAVAMCTSAAGTAEPVQAIEGTGRALHHGEPQCHQTLQPHSRDCEPSVDVGVPESSLSCLWRGWACHLSVPVCATLGK